MANSPVLKVARSPVRSPVLGAPGIRSISGMAAWYDFSDTATITASGGAVSAVTDKSGLGRNLSQGTAAQQPVTGTRTLAGKNVLDFNGTAHNLIMPAALYGLSNGANSIIAVFAADLTGGATQRIYNGQDAGTGRHYIGINATSFTAANNASGAGATTETWTKDAKTHVGVFTRDTTAQYTNIDGGAGASNASGTSFTSTQMLIGGQTSSTNLFDGVIAEMIFYSRALSLSEINVLGAYLSAKWGATWTSAV